MLRWDSVFSKEAAEEASARPKGQRETIVVGHSRLDVVSESSGITGNELSCCVAGWQERRRILLRACAHVYLPGRAVSMCWIVVTASLGREGADGMEEGKEHPSSFNFT